MSNCINVSVSKILRRALYYVGLLLLMILLTFKHHKLLKLNVQQICYWLQSITTAELGSSVDDYGPQHYNKMGAFPLVIVPPRCM